MKKAIDWLKKYSVAIIGGLIGLIAIILGIGYERKKIEKMKQKVEVATIKENLIVDISNKESAKKYEQRLIMSEEKVISEIKETEREIREDNKDVQNLDSSGIANKFNSLYK